MVFLLFSVPALAAVQSWQWEITDCDHDGLQDDSKLISQTITIQPNTQVCVVPPSYQMDALRIYAGIYIAGQYFPETSSGDARCKTVSSSTICTVLPGRQSGTITYSASTPTACSCNSCADCMTKLSTPSCTIVELTADITDHAGMCINYPAGFSGKIFDCKGHAIDGDSSAGFTGAGIYPSGGGNTIKNCIITGFDTGILLGWEGGGNTIAGNQISNNVKGIDVFNGQGNIITNNQISENRYAGIIFGGIAAYNSVIANEIQDNVSYGVLIQQSNESRGNTFTSNNICSFRGWDIYDYNYVPYLWPPARPNTGNDNICHDDRAFWRDDSVAEAGCRYHCPPQTAGCVGATKIFYCGDTVTESCTLSGSMTVCGSSAPPCLKIGASDITIDCNGYSITGYDLPAHGSPSNGIYSDYDTVKTWTTIKNCIIGGFEWEAVLLYSSPSATLTNNIVRSSGGGIYLSSSGGSTLTNNKANSNRNYGILLSGSPNCLVDNNTANSNRSSTDSTGIAVGSSNNVTLSNNTLNSNKIGMSVSSSSNCSLVSNTVNSSEHYGIRLTGSSANTLMRNSVSLTDLFVGIAITNSNSNLIYDNLFNNRENVNLWSSNNIWNTSLTPGTNIVEGP